MNDEIARIAERHKQRRLQSHNDPDVRQECYDLGRLLELAAAAPVPADGYATPVQQWNVPPCCGVGSEKTVRYNPYNRVIQCHACGHVYEPKPVAASAPQEADSIRRKAFDEAIAIAKRFGGACPGDVQMKMFAALTAAQVTGAAGQRCVKCGHGRDDPKRRGSDSYSSFCVYGCGCECEFPSAPDPTAYPADITHLVTENATLTQRVAELEELFAGLREKVEALPDAADVHGYRAVLLADVLALLK